MHRRLRWRNNLPAVSQSAVRKSISSTWAAIGYAGLLSKPAAEGNFPVTANFWF